MNDPKTPKRQSNTKVAKRTSEGTTVILDGIAKEIWQAIENEDLALAREILTLFKRYEL
jgi:hypothetical protein